LLAAPTCSWDDFAMNPLFLLVVCLAGWMNRNLWVAENPSWNEVVDSSEFVPIHSRAFPLFR